MYLVLSVILPDEPKYSLFSKLRRTNKMQYPIDYFGTYWIDNRFSFLILVWVPLEAVSEFK